MANNVFSSVFTGIASAISNAFGGLSFLSDGVARLTNAAGTGFGRLCFGPATSSFAAIKASGTTLLVRLADDSAATGILVRNVRLNPGTLAAAGSAPGVGNGVLAYATDLTSTTRGSTAVGGGALPGLVVSDGTNWIVV